MKCDKCTRQIRMVIYRYLNKEELNDMIEALPEKFQCDKQITINDKDSIIEIVCDGVMAYTVMKDRKMIYGITPEGSPLQVDVREEKKWLKKKVQSSKFVDKRMIRQASIR